MRWAGVPAVEDVVQVGAEPLDGGGRERGRLCPMASVISWWRAGSRSISAGRAVTRGPAVVSSMVPFSTTVKYRSIAAWLFLTWVGMALASASRARRSDLDHLD